MTKAGFKQNDPEDESAYFDCDLSQLGVGLTLMG